MSSKYLNGWHFQIIIHLPLNSLVYSISPKSFRSRVYVELTWMTVEDSLAHGRELEKQESTRIVLVERLQWKSIHNASASSYVLKLFHGFGKEPWKVESTFLERSRLLY